MNLWRINQFFRLMVYVSQFLLGMMVGFGLGYAIGHGTDLGFHPSAWLIEHGL
jgi:hypothetical protein